MSSARDIARAQLAPGEVLRRRLGEARGESSALMMVMIACALVFVAQWPRLAREAHLAPDGPDFNALFMGALFGWLFVMPLVLYGLALVVFWLLRFLARPVTAFEVRYAVFWGLLVTTPWLLLNGLVSGLIGPGPALSATGGLALAALVFFLVHGLFTINGREAQA